MILQISKNQQMSREQKTPLHRHHSLEMTHHISSLETDAQLRPLGQSSAQQWQAEVPSLQPKVTLSLEILKSDMLGLITKVAMHSQICEMMLIPACKVSCVILCIFNALRMLWYSAVTYVNEYTDYQYCIYLLFVYKCFIV